MLDRVSPTRPGVVAKGWMSCRIIRRKFHRGNGFCKEGLSSHSGRVAAWYEPAEDGPKFRSPHSGRSRGSTERLMVAFRSHGGTGRYRLRELAHPGPSLDPSQSFGS